MAKARRDGREAPQAPKPAPGAANAVTSSASPRRKLLLRLWGLLSLAALAEFIWIVGSFVRPRRGQADGEAGIVVAGPLDRFEPGSVSAFPAGKFYLVRLKAGGFMALFRECTHLGCTVPWLAEEARFACPCHASAFDITGQVLSPPAPRPLDLYAVRIENGIVKVDTRRRLPRASFDPSQVVWS
jgi:cytochrome b6-f complex iron-sulfur subunit